MLLQLRPQSQLAQIYNALEVEESYLCNFGVNPEYVAQLEQGGLKIGASDMEGQMRAIELPDHLFYIGTLFIPQFSSTSEKPAPLVKAFLQGM